MILSKVDDLHFWRLVAIYRYLLRTVVAQYRILQADLFLE